MGEGVHPNPPFAYDPLLYCYNGVIISAHVRVHIYPVVLYMFMNVKRRKRTLYVLCNWYKLVRKLVSLHCEFKTKKHLDL